MKIGMPICSNVKKELLNYMYVKRNRNLGRL